MLNFIGHLLFMMSYRSILNFREGCAAYVGFYRSYAVHDVLQIYSQLRRVVRRTLDFIGRTLFMMSYRSIPN